MKPINSNLIGEIRKKLEDGYSHRQISAQLGISVSTISKYRLTMANEELEAIPHARKGPPPKLSEVSQRKIVRAIRTGAEKNAVTMQQRLLQTDQISVSAETVRRVLRKSGLRGRAKVKKPLLTKRHRTLRYNFAKKYRNFSIEDWEMVVFSDETKINRLGSDGREWTWRGVGERLRPHMVKETLKFGGGNVMMWGCMRSGGVGMCERIMGRMTAQGYISILNNSLNGSLQKWGKTASDIIFQHDNDPKHTARVTKTWLQSQSLELLDWPPQSPDLNPIEHLWQQLKHKISLYSEPPRNLDEIYARASTEWYKPDPDACKNLVHSMPRRIEADLKALKADIQNTVGPRLSVMVGTRSITDNRFSRLME